MPTFWLLQKLVLFGTFCVSVLCRAPNILFLLADDLGWNDVGFHGSSQIDSPFIDSLANQGLILNNYYVIPLCTPSRAAVLTGRHPVTIGLQYRVIAAGQRSGIPLQYRLMPEYLNDLGYESHMIGKWHLGFFHKNYTPAYRGFKTFYGFYNGKNDYFDHRDNEFDWWGLDWRLDDGISDTVIESEFGQYSTRLMADRALNIIDGHSFKSVPLFLFMSFQATHAANSEDPIQVPTDTEMKYDNVWDVRRRKYVGVVNELDTAIEQIVNKLQSKGELDNTIIVFSTDNGGAANGFDNNWGNNFPLRSGKGYFYEGGTRGVAFVHGTMFQNRAGQVSTELIHITDWLPTLYEAAGGDLRYVSDLGSYSVLDVLTGKNLTSPRSEVLVNLNPYSTAKGIKVGRYKYMRHPEDNTDGSYDSWYQAPGPLPFSNETMVPNTTSSQVYCGDIPSNVNFSCYSEKSGIDECFYDLEVDPCEFYNLIDNPDYDSERQKVMDRLAYWESIQVEPIYPPVDPEADPVNFGYVWNPWTNDPRIPPNTVNSHSSKCPGGKGNTCDEM